MASNNRGRVGLGRIFSPRRRSASAVASQESQQKRRERRARQWRERFRKFALSSWQSSRIVQGVCHLFRSGSEAARAVRGATGSHIVGMGYGRTLSVEPLEQRQMLSTTPWVLWDGNLTQDWSNTSQITADDNWAGVPSMVGFLGDITPDLTTGTNPQTVLGPGTGTVDVIANQNNPNGNITGGVAEFHTFPAMSFSDDFESYADQAAFQAVWTPIGTVAPTSAEFSTAQSSSATHSIRTPGTLSNSQSRNRATFAETGSVSPGDQIVWSFDFYDSAPTASPARNYSNLQDTTAPSGTNQLIAMGFNNNQTGANSGGQYYMARILGYTVPTTADPDGGPNESVGGAGAFFKLNDFGAGARSLGWHNLKVVISTDDGLSTDYAFYVDNVLAERVSNIGTAASIRSYDNITIGSGLSNANTEAFFDNVSLQYTPNPLANPVVALQGSGTADAPFLNLYVNSLGRENIQLNFNLRDIDGSPDNSVQPVALQYRIGNTGDYIDVPAAFVTDASSGPGLATQVTSVSASLPEWSDVAELQLRIITTNAAGSDEWIGIDDIVVSSTAIPATYVDDDWAGYSNGQAIADADSTTPGNQPATFGTDAFATVQDGVNAALVSTRVNVNPGTYAESVTVNKSLWLRGAQHGVDARTRSAVPESIMDGTGLGGIFTVSVDDVTIDGFSIQGQTGGYPGGAIWMQPGTEGTEVRNNIIQNNVIGIMAANNSATNETLIEKNLFQNNTNAGAASGHGIYADEFGAGIGMQNVRIDNNKFTNTVHELDTWALGISNSNATPFTDITFSNNEVTNHGRGTYFFNTDGATVSGNTFTAVERYAVGVFTLGGSDNNANFDISNNTITNHNNPLGDARGIWVDGYSGVLDLDGNQITGGEVGLEIADVDGSVTRVNLSNLTLSGNTTGGTITNVDTVSLTMGAADDAFAVTTTSLSATGSTTVQEITLSAVSNIEVHGEGGTMDSLTISGTFGTVVYDYTNANDGSVDLGSVTVHYTGLDPITNTGTVTDVVFTLTAGADNATLEDIGGGMLRLSGGTFETTDFLAPTGSLTINGGDDADELTVDDAISIPSVTLNVETVNLGHDITATTLAGGANTLEVNVLDNDAQIQDAIVLVAVTGIVNVLAGTYVQDVNVNKTLSLMGTGAGSTTLSGAIGGDNATVRVSANNVEVAGFTITREGNNLAQWNDPALNSAGVAIIGPGLTGMLIHDNVITGNRTGIDVNNSSGHTIRNNAITDNRTGLLFRNQTDSLTVVENDISDNWTVGILFLDASGGTNVPVQTALASTFSNNDLSGNWYGQIVDRQTGGVLPAPGTTNLKNFSGNWFGTTNPVITTANSAEPGYAALIPVAFGGSATPPGGQPDIAGAASANFDITPYLNAGTDSNVETTPGRGTFGFQGDFSIVVVDDVGADTSGLGRINDGINHVTTGGTVKILAGTYSENVDATTKSVTLSPGASPAQVTVSDLTLDGDDTLAIEINGLTAGSQYDQFIVTGTATLGGAAVSASGSYLPLVGDDFTIVDAATLVGTLSTTTATLNNFPLTVTYPGGGDIVLTLETPTDVWVDNDWVITSDIGAPGLSYGDLVESDADDGDTPVSGKTYGYDAFASVGAGVTAVDDGGTVHVLAGTYNEAVVIDGGKTVDVLGQSATLVTLNGGMIPTPLRVAGGATVLIDQMRIAGGIFGIDVDNASLMVTNAIVTGGSAIGVLIDNGADVTIEDSLLDGTGSGTGVAAIDGSLTLSGSTLTDRTDGVVVATNGSATIFNNDLSDTFGSFAIQADPAAGVIDASGNWWGTNLEAGVQAKTQGLIDFSPYLDLGTNNATNGIGFDGDFSHLHVTTLGEQSSGGRVSEAIGLIEDGALTGDARLVQVHSGNYVEDSQVFVDRDVTVTGDAVKPVITPGQNFTGGNAANAWILVDSGVTFNLNSVEIDGDGYFVWQALRSHGDTTIDGVDFRDIQGSASGSPYRGVAVQSFGGTVGGGAGADSHGGGGSASHLIVKNSTFDEIGRIGVLVKGDGATAGIENNQYTGKGAGDWLDYAFEAGAGAKIDVIGNTVTGNLGVASDSSTSAGILVTTFWGAGTEAHLSGNNVVSGNTDGVHIGFGTTDSSLVTITGGTFSSNTASGIHVGGTATVEIHGATITGNDTGVTAVDGADVTIDSDTVLSGNQTGVLVASGADATITGNAASIYGNVIGIDVDGGSATIDSNHIYDNTTGIRFTNGGTGTVEDNDFEGGVDPDNGTDIRYTITAGAVAAPLTGNTFAGTTYIDNQSPHDITALRSPYGTNFYNVAGAATTNDFVIEGRIYHQIDNAASGLVTWVPDTIFVASVAETGSTPTDSDNDYTRIKNAIEAAGDNDMIQLLGGGANAFDWTEPFAFASWQLGNDGVVSPADDYAIVVPVGLDNVTLTAAAGLGSATIQGPGDLPGVNLEGVFFFDGGDNKGWTISDLQIRDFDLSIAFFNGAGGSDAFDNTTITNNYIRVPADLNVTAAPADANQNIGIHYSFGANQTISNNVIELVGNGVSDGTSFFSSSVGMQSNTSGGGVYDGLLIDNNTINVTGTLDSQQASFLGIWENAHGHSSDITVSNNDFYNLTGNNAATNLMRAFRVTSHSSGSTTVTYSGNTVDGANIGFQWITPSNFAGNQPVEVSGNILTNVNTGFLVQSNGLADFRGNSLTNSGAMLGVGLGIDVRSGSIVTVDGSTNENEIVGFATGIKAAGTVTVTGNDASIHGNAIGIDVDGGLATITANHIYDNTTGIRFINGGAGSVDNNNFEGGGSDDNATDVELTSSAGAISSLSSNDFAGDTYFIDNQTSQSFDLSSDGSTFDEANNFRIEDKMHHRMDTSLTVTNGLVTWVAGNLYVTTPGGGSTDSEIQRGIDAASAGNTVNVEAGTYVENLSINKNLTLLSDAGRASTTIQGTSGMGDLGTIVLSGTTTDVNIGGASGNGFTIQGIDNGLPGIENAAIYISGSHSDTDILWNDIVAMGDHGLLAEFAATMSDAVIDNNILSGQTFLGPNPAGTGFSAQFTLANVPRQLAVIANEANKTNITFTNNQLTGVAGGISLTDNTGAPVAAHEQGNVLVTIDATGTLLADNVFTGTTNSTAFSLRARGPNNIITGNQFTSAGMGATTSDLFVNDTGNVIQGNTFSSTAGAAILVSGGSSTIGGTGVGESNTINGYSVGIAATAGNVLVEDNDLSGNTVGIRVSGGAVVDAGSDNGLDGNPTGLGNSAGLNILTGYTGTGGNYAIEDLNLAVQSDVYARFNDFGPYVDISIIEDYVFDDTDDGTRSEVIFAGALNQQPAANVVFVDDSWIGTSLGTDADGAGGGSLGNGTAFGVDQFANIEDALAAVAGGATSQVLIYNGQYYTSGYNVNKDVTIQGESRGGVIVAPTDEDSHEDDSFTGVSLQQAFIVSVSGVTISTLTIDGDANLSLTGNNNFRSGIITPDNVVDLSDLLFTNLDVKNIYRRGIQISWAGNNNEISDNLVEQDSGTLSNGGAAIGVFGGMVGATTATRILDNDLTNVSQTGIVSNFGALLDIRGNTITATPAGMNLAALDDGSIIGAAGDGNTIDMTGSATDDVGVQVTFSGDSPFNPGTVTIEDNDFIASGGDTGIMVFRTGSDALRIIGNTFTSSGSTSSSTGEGTAIFITDDDEFFGESSTDNDANVEIQGNTITEFHYGVHVRAVDDEGAAETLTVLIGGPNVADNNDISGTGAPGSTGILVEDNSNPSSADVTVQNNNASISGFAVGIDVVGGTANISGNNIFDNGIGVRLSNATGDLTNNSIDSNYQGISVLGASTLTLTGGTVDDNESNGLIVDGDGVVKQTIVVDGTSFSSNSTGKPVSAGHGDITLFEFAAAVADPSTASFNNVTINSDLPDYAIQVRGVAGTLPFLNGSTTAQVTFDSVDILGTQQRYAMLIQQYADLSDFSFTDVTFDSAALGGLVMFDTGDAGVLDLGNTTFHDGYTGGDGPGNGTGADIATSLTDIDATDATFLDSLDVALDKTDLQANFTIEDRVAHVIDADAPGPLVTGLIDWVDAGPFANALFVTQESYVPPVLSTTPSIQRGIDAATAGDDVWVEGGAYTYTENLTIGKDLNLRGETGNTPNLQPAVAGNLITIDGAAFGDDQAVLIENFNFNGLAGLADRGILVPVTADFVRLIVQDSSFTGFDFNAIIVDGTGTGSLIDDVQLSDLSFTNNGLAGGGGSADVQLFIYNGDASFTNLTHVGSASGTSGIQSAIQLRGIGAGTGVGVLPMGTVSFDNVDISGDYVRQFIGIQRYEDVSGLTFNDVELGGAGSQITGTFGASLRFDGIGDLSTKGLVGETTVDLGNTYFRGLDSYTNTISMVQHPVYDIEFAPDNSFAWLRADGMSTRWNTTTGPGVDVAAASLSLAQAFEVEDRILHFVDKLHPTHGGVHGPYKGFVDIQAGNAFITDEADLGTRGDGSISRGVNIVALNGTVNVDDGTYQENVIVNRSVTIDGQGINTILNAGGGHGFEMQADDVTVRDLRVTNTAEGFRFASTTDNSDLLHVQVDAAAQGIHVQGMVTDLTLDDVTLTGNVTGMRVATLGSVVGLDILNSHFDDNQYGATIYASNSITNNETRFTDILIQNSTFNDNDNKGLYFEKLNNATFDNVVVDNSGHTGAFGAGIDINLKYGTYSNIDVLDGSITDSGTGDAVNGVGLTIKARGTGNDPSYSANPALLTDVIVDGMVFDGNQTGIRIGEPGRDNTSPTGVTIDGVTIEDSVLIGVDVVGGEVTIQNSELLNNPTGIRVVGAGRAIIIDNPATITGGSVGIDVNGGTALVENTDVNGNTIGVRIQNGGKADLGQNGPGINFTGLGISDGLNDFSGFTAAATSTSGAIVNLNAGGAYSNAGPQGYAGPEYDVAAFNNSWDTNTPTGIENVVWHDADDTSVGFLDYQSLTNLVVSLDPLPSNVIHEDMNEGGSVTVYGEFTNDAQAHTVTINWGDGSPNTVLNLGVGVFTFAINSPAGVTYTDDPNGPVQFILHNITVTVEEDANPGNFQTDTSLSVDVNNVIPDATLSTTDGDINEGQLFSLDISAAFDPGDDTIMSYRINWGDGTNDVIPGNLATAVNHTHTYLDGLAIPNVTITLDLFDEDGTWNTVDSLGILVHNVNPTAGNFFSFDAVVNEGSTTTVFFVGPFTDPGNPDTPFHFAYDFNGNGIYGEAGEVGDGTYAGSGTATSALVPAAFLADDDDSPRTVKARIIDNDGGFTEYSVMIDINNVAPVVNAGADSIAFNDIVFNHMVSFTDPGADAPWTVNVDWNGDGDFLDSGEAAFNTNNHTFNISHTYGMADIGNTYNVKVQVDDNDGGVHFDIFQVTVVEDTFRVIDFQTFASGFDITFNRAPDLGDLNLYDGLDVAVDLPDLTVQGNVLGMIDGSMVWDAATNRLTWIKTGGVLAADTYTVTLISDSVAFEDTMGNLLDGDGDFDDSEVNDDFVDNFTVVPSADRVVSIRDFARGAGQDVHVPNTGLHLPVSISNAAGVTAVDVDVLYDPTLLNISAATLGAGPLGAGGWSITTNSIVIDANHTLLKITISGINALSGSNVELIRLNSDISATAPYGSSQVIRLQGLRVNEDLIASKADYALHKAIYVGDADGDGSYGGTDSALISRVVVNLDTGFDAHDWTDPVIAGDASGDGTLSGLDASYVAQEAVLIDVPEVPPIPGIPLIFSSPVVDPQYSIDTNIVAQRGGSVIVPVELEVLPTDVDDNNVIGGTLVLEYDDSLATYQSTTQQAGWTVLFSNEPQPGVVRVAYTTDDLLPASVGQSVVANIEFSVSNSVTSGTVSELDVRAANPNEGGLVWTDIDGGLLIAPATDGDYNDDFNVNAADYVVWRKFQNMAVPNYAFGDGDGDGTVQDDDYDLWAANYGEAASGSGGSVGSGNETVQSAASVSFVSAMDAAPAVTAIESAKTASTQVAHDEALAGMGVDLSLAATFNSQRTARPAARTMGTAPAKIDQYLLDIAIEAERDRDVEQSSWLGDEQSRDDTESIDELFAALESEKLAGVL